MSVVVWDVIFFGKHEGYTVPFFSFEYMSPRPGGYGRGEGRGRRSGRGLQDEKQKKNQFDYLHDEAYEDDDDEDDEDEYEEEEFEDEVDLAMAAKEITAGNGGKKAEQPAKGFKQATKDDKMKEFVDALYGDEFIPESEFKTKQTNDGSANKFANEMVGVVTEIKKKRQLSIDDTVYDKHTDTHEETDTAGQEGQQDTANKSGSAKTHSANGNTTATKGTVQNEDKHADATENVATKITSATEQTPSNKEDGKTAVGGAEQLKGSKNEDKDKTTATQSVAVPANNKVETKGGDTGAATVLLKPVRDSDPA
jgi:hypothetical protein